MTASLHHAQSILSAAINAGFRESGVQSLKNLDDPNPCPMAVVRTSGLGLEVLIRFVPEGGGAEDEIQSLVDETYLEILTSLANRRFVTNTERIRRFWRESVSANE